MSCTEIVTANDLKLALGSGSQYDIALLSQIAEQASLAVETYCGREFGVSTKSEIYTGNGHCDLPLRRTPLTAIAGVYVDPARQFGNDTMLIIGEDYVVDWCEENLSKSGIITLLQWPYQFLQMWPIGWGPNPSWGGLTQYGRQRTVWPESPGVIKVTYTAGYDKIPADLKGAGVQIGCWMLSFQATGGMIQTGTYIDVSTSFAAAVDALGSGAVPALGSARDILSRYRRLPWPTGG